MDRRQVERFVDVVESGSLTRTSERLHISQPALSKSLRHMEEELGYKLLERGPRGIKVTKFGDVFYRRARSIKAEFRRAGEELDALIGSTAGEVAVGSTSGPGILDRILPDAIYRIAVKRPDLKFTVRSGTASQLLPSLASGELDFLFTVLDDNVRAPNLHIEPLFEDHFVLVVNRRHPLLKAETITLQDLCKFRWVMLQDASDLWRSVEQRAKRQGIATMAPIQSNSVVFVRTLVTRTEAIGILPSYAAELGGTAGELTSLPIDHIADGRVLQRLSRPMGLVLPTEIELTPSARAVLRSINTVCHELNLRKGKIGKSGYERTARGKPASASR